MYKSKEEINNRLQEHYAATKKLASNEVFGVFLQGSQNYIDDKFLESSDVDSRALFLPSKRDIILGLDNSKETFIIDDEHIEIYDIRKGFDLLRKASINNYEMLYTDYYLINNKYFKQYEALLELREEIVRMDEKQFLMSLMGMSLRQLKMINDKDGDYRKRVAYVIRLNETAKAYIAGKDFQACLKAMDQDLIHEIRTTDYYSLEEALQIGAEKDAETKKLAMEFENETGKEPHPTSNKIDEILVDLVTVSMG